MYYLNTFILYSILGFLLETIRSTIVNSKFTSGIMYGPWTPIYGCGVILVVVLSNYLFTNLHLSKIMEIIIFFIVITLILTLLELLGGIFIEKVFKIVFWDYSKETFSIGKYVSLSKSLIWGLGSIVFLYLIKPFLDSLIKKIPLSLTLLFIILMITDFMFTLYIKSKI